MRYPNINIFAAWFFIVQTIAMGWVAAVGRILLELLGVNTFEGDIPGRLVGAILLFGAIYLVLHLRGSLWPQGKPEGSGFKLGHRLLLVANALAASLLCFEITRPFFADHNLIVLTSGFTDAFGYWVMAMWAIGFSFVYQSALPQSVKNNS